MKKICSILTSIHRFFFPYLPITTGVLIIDSGIPSAEIIDGLDVGPHSTEVRPIRQQKSTNLFQAAMPRIVPAGNGTYRQRYVWQTLDATYQQEVTDKLSKGGSFEIRISKEKVYTV